MSIQIISTMLMIGILLGFIGAGGSGFIISILTVMFGISIHMALGTALLTMILSSLSGAVSHYREGNIRLKTGIMVGIAGALGSWGCSMLSDRIPSGDLKWMTATMLIVSGLALWLRIIIVARRRQPIAEVTSADGLKFQAITACVGLTTGSLSGLFGIGSTPFIQIGLMQFLGMSVRLAAGTTMLVIIPIALGGGLGYYRLGYIDMQLLVQVAASVMIGTYIGAKFTKRVPALILQIGMVLFPIIGGAILLIEFI